MRPLALVLALAAGCMPHEQRYAPVPAWIDDTSTFGATAGAQLTLADRYRGVAATILTAARADRGAYRKLEQLTDRIGNRIIGSAALDHAIAWAVDTLHADGHDARTEKVMVPHWVRGAEDGAIVTPVARPLHLLGLGNTVPTGKLGLTAPVVVVHDWHDLDAKRDAVKGAIVLFDVAMAPWSATAGSGYGAAVDYRVHGAARAATYGAVGMLMRTVTAHSLRSPHTGSLSYVDGVAQIPAAAVTVEDAELITRLAATGPVSVHLHLESQTLPDAVSANVIGELRGREQPDEVVVIGGHLDSWDVGQGAHDDGAGCVIMMQAITVLRQLKLVPRRTIRVVLFAGEEKAQRGADAYAADHAGELGRTVMAMESDSGGFAPRGLYVGDKTPAVATRVRSRVADLLTLVGGMRVVEGGGGTDIEPMEPSGVPTLGLDVWNATYFDIHHSEADTLDKVDPKDLAADVAVVALVAYIVADMPGRLDDP